MRRDSIGGLSSSLRSSIITAQKRFKDNYNHIDDDVTYLPAQEVILELICYNDEVAHFLNKSRLRNTDIEWLQTRTEEWCSDTTPDDSECYFGHIIDQHGVNHLEKYEVSAPDSVCMLHFLMLHGPKKCRTLLESAGLTEQDFENYIEKYKDWFWPTENNNNMPKFAFARNNDVKGLPAQYNQEKQDNNDATNDNQNGVEEDSYLEKYGTDLTRKANNGNIDPAVGRETEIAKTINVLNKRKRNTPLLVGEPGVGKTAIVEEIARRSEDTRIFELTISNLVAGTRYRGDFEKRVESILQEIDRRVEKGQHITLFIDEIHTIMGAGATSEGTNDLSNMLKPRLSDGRLALIGATTFDEEKHIQKNKAMGRRFRSIHIDEPDMDNAVDMIQSQLDQLAKEHNVIFPEDAARHLAESVKRHFGGNHGRLPDKAVDIADEAAAEERAGTKNAPEGDNANKSPSVTVERFNRVIENMRGLREGALSENDSGRMLKLADNLTEHVFGQDKQLRQIARTLKSNYTLGDDSKPQGSFLLAGGRGVGKTETARAIAKLLDTELMHYDMQEYAEQHTASRLLGAPPGLVGYGEETIVDHLLRNPRAVFLFDEIEKAHPDVQKLFMTMLERGVIEDRQGRSAKCDRAVIVMTTNAGAEHAHKENIGFIKDAESRLTKALKASFANPEFLDRFDGIHVYNDITEKPEIQTHIVNKVLDTTHDKLLAKWNVHATFDDALVEHIRQNGISPAEGARPVSRFVRGTVEEELADELLREHITPGSHIRVDLAPEGSGQTITYNFLQNARDAGDTAVLSPDDEQPSVPALRSAEAGQPHSTSPRPGK